MGLIRYKGKDDFRPAKGKGYCLGDKQYPFLILWESLFLRAGDLSDGMLWEEGFARQDATGERGRL